ncbi:hypothetical protein YQE_03414, partial [Dendroctonus ponderosae]
MVCLTRFSQFESSRVRLSQVLSGKGKRLLNFLTKTYSIKTIKLNMTQTYPTDWDADDYKDETEPEEHWELRKAFMETHKGSFSEDYLVALARTFTNIEFMGCSYPTPVMIRIAELSKDIAKNYRESQKNKLKRTFVSASNAAENKIKKRTSTPGSYVSNNSTK